MGNISSMARASSALDSYVAELGNDISYDRSLSSSRFLKSILARHALGPLVLKIFIKPDSAMSLRVIQRRLKAERDALADLSSVNTYQAFVETEKAGYLIRQWAGSNLYDRVSTQPYLALIEKKWIAFQLLTALRDARSRKVAHGDIKSENVLINSDLTLLLTDFSSSFKPTYLPLDDPSDFSFFFDTSSRRTCYIAPERFYTADSRRAEEKRATTEEKGSWGKRDGKVTEEMDVFSAGCVIAEMWTDGRTVFNLSELFAYREGSVGLEGILDNIEDENVQVMISQMLSRSPSDRPSFDRILSVFRGSIFPEYFYTFLKDYIATLSEVPEKGNVPFLLRVSPVPGTKIDRIWEEWDSIVVHLDAYHDSSSQDNNVGPGLLLLSIITSSIRNCLWPTSRLHALQLFLRLLPYLSDEAKVDRVVPYVTELFLDDVAIVRAEACRTVVLVVESITSITPQNATFIPEYLLPQMRHLSTDPDIFVRATYARGLVRLGDAAVTMLEMDQAAKVDQEAQANPEIEEPDYDSLLLEIQNVVEEQATTLLVDSTAAVKRSTLSSIADLCLFFGRQKSSETVLSHIMTYLNDRDWMLRLAFFDAIVGVGAFIGIRAIEEYVLPLMIQALADPEEAVVARVISALTSLASLGLLPRMRLWDVFFSVKGFLVHPNAWIRQGTAGFISAAVQNLPESDVWCILYPSVRVMLHSDILKLEEESIMSALVTPLSRASLIAAKTASLQNSPHGFWHVSAPEISSKLGLIKDADGHALPDSNLLREKGISPKEEKRIVLLKEFIFKQAQGGRARETSDASALPESSLVNGQPVSLTDLGVTPQTVFISPRTVGIDAKSDLRRLKPLLGAEASSRRTSFTNRSSKGVENPLEEIRKKLATMEPPSTPAVSTVSDIPVPPSERSPSESAFGSSLDLAAMTKAGKKKVDSKAAPAVGASHANATGETAVPEDSIASSRMTPTASSSAPPRGPFTPYSSSYEGQDPGVRAYLEQIDLENYRQPLLDFGPRITASQRKRSPRPNPPSTGPGVTMIAHLTQHSGPVTAIVTAPDQAFFATASDDSQVLIWDTARLERSVATKARLTYRMDAPITAMSRLENTHCMAVAAEDGQVHVLRVHVTTSGSSVKYGRVECVRTWRTNVEKDGHVVFVSHLRDSTLLVVTSMSVIALLDLRSVELTTRFQNPLEYGGITSVCASTYWTIVGTETGTLCLWDLRFGLLLKSWKASGPITTIQIHPVRGRGRWVMVSTERTSDTPLVEVYDVETEKLVEVYEVSPTRSHKSSTRSANTTTFESKADLIAELASRESSVPTTDDAEPSSVLALIVGQSFASTPIQYEGNDQQRSRLEKKSSSPTLPGWMITSGEDRVVRYWDLVKIADGFVVCGSPREADVNFRQSSSTNPSVFYTQPNAHRSSLDLRDEASSQLSKQPLKPHYDGICALGTVETPFSSCVISGDRSGVVKVWRMEGLGGGR